jgi:predicted PurR-regulated permease PerM
LAVFLGYVVFQTLDVLYLILTAYIVAISMESVIEQFEKKSCPRGVAIVITYLILVTILL